MNRALKGIKGNALLVAALALLAGLFIFFPPFNAFSPTANLPMAKESFKGPSFNEKDSSPDNKTAAFLSEKAESKELYEMINCPCCGSPISKNCCGAATERMAFVDRLVDSGKNKKEVLFSVAKKYGMESIIDKETRKALRQELVESAPEGRPKISIEPKTFDFGNVSLAKGEVSTAMLVRNEGKTDLIINDMESSCGCTSAAIVFKGTEGPRFGMSGHGKKPENWSVKLPPGESAELKVYYNPAVHPTLRGPVTRTVSVFSNDPVDFEVKVKITVNQVS